MREFSLDWQKGYEDGLRVGIENETNHILKLLKNRMKGCEGHHCESCDEQIGLIAATRLIKGEQK